MKLLLSHIPDFNAKKLSARENDLQTGLSLSSVFFSYIFLVFSGSSY